jgi:hypothetical protein
MKRQFYQQIHSYCAAAYSVDDRISGAVILLAWRADTFSWLEGAHLK